jgi:hypothetical protein
MQMRSELDSSSDIVTALRTGLVEKNGLCEGLKSHNVALHNEHNEARDNDKAFELKLAKLETDAAASSAAAGKHFEDYCTKTAEDTASLREAYERSIDSLGGIYAPIGDGAPSADDYLRWLKYEVDAPPEIFHDVNENFVSVVLEGVLHMLRRQHSVDLEALQRVAGTCGTTVFPPPTHTHDVKKTLHKIAKGWWHPFGYTKALSIARTKLREVT